MPAALAHAAHEAVDDPGFGVGARAEEAHFAEGFEFCFFADGAGVDEDDVGLGFVLGELVAVAQKHAGDLFGVALVHLAAVGFDEDAGHGRRAVCVAGLVWRVRGAGFRGEGFRGEGCCSRAGPQGAFAGLRGGCGGEKLGACAEGAV